MTQQQIIVNNRRSLLIFADRHGVSQACRAFGISRTSFYKVKEQFLKTGSLEPQVRRKPSMPNETALSKKKILLRLVLEHPLWGPGRYAHELRQQGICLSPEGIWYCLKRFGLNKRYQRLVYIESLRQQQQPITERNLKAIKHHADEIRRGLWPGHIVALDTFYVGNLKGVGRIYQITGLDLCSRYGWAKLYTTKEQSSSLDFVEQCLLPKFFVNNVPLESVLTDNGSEFIGNQFQKMLKDYDIAHHRIPCGKPMMNGYCERFQRTIFEEFYQPVFRKKFFKNLQELQRDLEQYLTYYNFDRAHFGLLKTGSKPIDVFKSKRAVLRLRFSKLLT